MVVVMGGPGMRLQVTDAWGTSLKLGTKKGLVLFSSRKSWMSKAGLYIKDVTRAESDAKRVLW